MSGLNSRGYGLGLSLMAVAYSMPAVAGDQPLYQAAADWTRTIPLADVSTDTAAAELLIDNQFWFEGGTVYHYFDRVIRVDSPDVLTSEGTLQAQWLPDKGDLVVNSLQILRGDEIIDLIAGGTEFEVLRREQNLESRLLDGQLTATLAVPGLRIGDILRLAYTVSNKDQAMGKEMQETHYLFHEPYQVGKARVRASWPEGEQMFWQAGPDVDGFTQATENGVTSLSIDLPLARRKDMPYDAPMRFHRSPILSIGSFTDWQELSRVMEPHFTKAAVIEGGSDLAGKVAGIMAATSDPMERAVLATRMVQDEVSYLMNGLDGGNYLPQTAEHTWENLYGDCKAKSVLLHAMLLEMGIESHVVLVATNGGDALPGLLPLPAHLNHMIVRANIDGMEYWIDGTSTGTRRTNIGEVPPFHHALALTEAGADLAPMTQRQQPWPDTVVTVNIDNSAGFDLPGIMTAEMQFYGPMSAQMRQMANRMDDDAKQQMLRQMASGGSSTITDFTVSYDDDAAMGTMKYVGVMDSGFVYDDGESSLDLVAGEGVQFAPDRARSAWRDLPAATNGPSRTRVTTNVILPDDGEGYRLEGAGNYSDEAANQIVIRETTLDGSRFSATVEAIQLLGEIAPEDIAAERRAALAFNSKELKLTAPEALQWRWEVTPQELARRVAPLRARYDAAVAQADADDFGPLTQRYAFNELVLDYPAAIADLDTIIEEEATVDMIAARAGLYYQLGEFAAAERDASTAFDLDPSPFRGAYLAGMMARRGSTDEALSLLASIPASGDDLLTVVEMQAHTLAMAGRDTEALVTFQSYLADNENTAEALNSDCWFRAVFEIAMDNALSQCTAAVEQSDQPANSLDSRAMLYFKRGDYAAALADLDAALRLDPMLSGSLYLRGLTRLEMGDAEGRDDIRSALRLMPSIAQWYEPYGIEMAR